MRLLQISDPHLLAATDGRCRGRQPWPLLHLALQQGLAAAQGRLDLVLFSGDLCHDESWLGYAQLRDLLQQSGVDAAYLPGNHDNPQLLRAALGRRGAVAPAVVRTAALDLVLLDSHRPGSDGGWLGPRQLQWLDTVLASREARPLLVAVHHPPLAIGDPRFDAIALADGDALLDRLRPLAALQVVLFGHIHQHWQGLLPARPPQWPAVPLLGCPSSLCSFGAVQPCPLGRAEDPGARLLEFGPDGCLMQQQLLRWRAPLVPSLWPARTGP